MYERYQPGEISRVSRNEDWMPSQKLGLEVFTIFGGHVDFPGPSGLDQQNAFAQPSPVRVVGQVIGDHCGTSSRKPNCGSFQLDR